MSRLKFLIFILIFIASIAPPVLLSEYSENTKDAEDIRIMMAGDLMFDRGIRYYAGLNNGNDFIFEKLSPILAQNDLNIVNLEGPITNNKSVSSGTVPGSANNYFFTFDPSVAKTLFAKNIKVVSLANNHILNFGREGLAQTKQYLKEAGVNYFERSVSTEIKGVKIAFVAYNESAQADKTAEQKKVLEEIKKAKGESDIVIVFAHWGVEYSKIPEKPDVELAHKFIDQGASFIAGSHPHVVQTTELYKGKRIYYSLGNFIFDQYFNEDVRRGLGVVLKINPKTKEINFEEINFYLASLGQTEIAQ